MSLPASCAFRPAHPEPRSRGRQDQHSGVKLCQIIVKIARKAKRDGKQSCGLRRQIQPRRIRAPHDLGNGLQRRTGQAELFDHHVKRAGLAPVAPEHALYVKRRGVESLGDALHLRRRDKQEFRIRINKPADQPRAGNPVDLRTFPRDPPGYAVNFLRQRCELDCRQSRIPPCNRTALKHDGCNTAQTHLRRHAFAELQPFVTADDDNFAGKLVRPTSDIVVRPRRRARYRKQNVGNIFSNAHIDNRRGVCRSDQVPKFRG